MRRRLALTAAAGAAALGAAALLAPAAFGHGLVGRKEAGVFLSDHVFRPGQSVRWDTLVERATGGPLTATHLAREIARGLPS